MQIRLNAVTRGAIGLVLGYWTLFFLLPLMRRGYMAPGILDVASDAFLPAAIRFNPIRLINNYLFGSSPIAIEFALLLGYLSLCYAWSLHSVRVRREPITLKTILAWVIVFGLPLFVLPRLLSSDVYSYTMYGRISAIYGASPMFVPPATFPTDPLLKYMTAWRDSPSYYGPVWLLFSHGLTLVVNLLGQTPWLYVCAYKLTAIGLHVVNAVLIWGLLGRWKPAQQTWGTLLYAWNPLALIEFAGSGHNDALQITCLLLAFWAAQSGSWRRATAKLSVAALIKYIPALLLPLYAILLVRERATWRARLSVLGQAAGLSILIAVLLIAPFWVRNGQISTILSSPTVDAATNSLASLAVDALPRSSAQDEIIIRAALWGGRAILAAAWLVAAVVLWRRPTFERLVAASFWVLLFFVLFGTMWFEPWYATWPLALAALLDWRPAGRTIIVFTATVGVVYAAIPMRLVFVFAPVAALLIQEAWCWARRCGRSSGGGPTPDRCRVG